MLVAGESRYWLELSLRRFRLAVVTDRVLCDDPPMIPRGKPSTWTDYQSWDDDTRWEIIDGHPYAMSSPTYLHQQLLGALFLSMSEKLKGHRCQVVLSPFDVRLSEYDVVQPDILVVCEPERLRKAHYEGAPSLVVEILSPSTSRHDRVRKLALYARCGVPEYWIVSPEPAMLEVLTLAGDCYRLRGFMPVDEVRSSTIPELKLRLAEIFVGAPPPAADEVKEGRPPTYSTP